MFELHYEPRHNVLMTRIHKSFVPDDIFVRDRIAANIVIINGPARGIMDFTGVNKVEVPISTLVKRANAQPVLWGTDKVMVAPHDSHYEICRVFAAHTLVSRKKEPLIVRSLPEAFSALGMADPKFEQVDHTDVTAKEVKAVHRLVSRVDRAYGGDRPSTVEREKVRATFLRLIGAAAAQASEHRLLRHGRSGALPSEVIRMSDVLNAIMRHAIVTDGDLVTACPKCRARRSLDMCRVSTGRKTTYACATCDSVLVVVTPARAGTPRLSKQGYPFGRFGVMNVSAIECVGARLPRHPLSAAVPTIN